jgi:NAD(P)-dependent dehydrogenase (short-subunit alcohol dehydrogenase family)
VTAVKLLRDDLLRGRAIALAGGGRDHAASAQLGERMCRLGARVERWHPDPPVDEDSAEAWARSRAPLHALVYDASASFGAGGQDALQSSVAHAWLATRAIAKGALIPGADGGKVLLLAPGPDAGAYAQAARAALENLTRTLSIEWARHGVTAVTIAPGSDTTSEQLTTLACFLVSPAGDYFSGARFDLVS